MSPILRPRPFRVAALAVGLMITLAGTGCGEKRERRDSAPRPALPIVVGAFIAKDEIRLSPAEIGAGQIDLIVSNRSGAPRRIILQGPGGVALTTTPISDGESSKAQAIVEPGVYRLNAGPGVPAAELTVGPERPSSNNELVTP